MLAWRGKAFRGAFTLAVAGVDSGALAPMLLQLLCALQRQSYRAKSGEGWWCQGAIESVKIRTHGTELDSHLLRYIHTIHMNCTMLESFMGIPRDILLILRTNLFWEFLVMVP